MASDDGTGQILKMEKCRVKLSTQGYEGKIAFTVIYEPGEAFFDLFYAYHFHIVNLSFRLLAVDPEVWTA
jgi:hypothetical protein